MLALKAPKGAKKFVVKMRMACGVECDGTMFLPRSTRAQLLLGQRVNRANAKEPIVIEKGMITLRKSESKILLEGQRHIVLLHRSPAPFVRQGQQNDHFGHVNEH